MEPFHAEALIIGGDHRVSGGNRLVEQGLDGGYVFVLRSLRGVAGGAADGGKAHRAVVQVRTGHPPAGGSPFGTARVPDTATGAAAGPSERYSSRRFRAALGNAMVPVKGRLQMTDPRGPSGSGEGGT